MLTEKQLVSIATSKMIELFGKQYLRENFDQTCKVQGFSKDNVFMFFLGIKGKDALPDREAEKHGWVVFGEVLVNATTGDILNVDYALE